MGNISISGAVSGLDTAGIIDSLVALQKNQQTLLSTQQTSQQKAATALGNLSTGLSTLSSLAAKVGDTKSWNGLTATSSSTNVTVSASGSQPASVSFDVLATAKAHAVVSADAVSSMATKVATGPLTLTKADGSTIDIATGNVSLSSVIAAINSSASGLTASAVQTSPGQYRLQVMGTKSGAASEFSLGGLSGFAGMNVLTQGSDAQIRIGDNPATAYTVNSSTNSFNNVVGGLSFTVSRVETGVTASSTVDGSSIADNIGKMVDQANSVLSSIAAATAYDATTKTGGPLLGDASVRGLQQQILNLVGGSGTPGISLTRDGKLSFSKEDFKSAYVKDPQAVATAYGAGTTFDAAPDVAGTVRYSSSTTSVQAGNYAVKVTSLAAVETWTADASGSLDGKEFSFGRGSKTASYTVASGASLTDIAAGINAANSAAGLGITAKVDGTNLVFTASGVGSANAFTATVDGDDATRTVAGADVQGTIDGRVATGSGNKLSLLSGTSKATGLVLDVALTQADLDATGGDVGAVTVHSGLAQRFIQLAKAQTDSSTGSLNAAKANRESAVKDLQTQIDKWDTRLETYRTTLQRQFTAMETALSSLKSQTSWLSTYGLE